jgi:hypothetical protein
VRTTLAFVARTCHASNHGSWGTEIMVAFNRVRCTVVAVSELQRSGLSRSAKARDVLPWADPYVAQLIKKLQDEVRLERRLQSRFRDYRATDSEVSAA